MVAESDWLRDQHTQYDQAAKRILAQRRMLAWILSRVVTEFKGVSIHDIADKYIVGEPEIGTVPVNRDKTNAPRDIQQDRNEDGTSTEGTVYFDIRFHAKAPKSGELITLIINVEAQKENPSEYTLLKRAVFYACRLISAQKETEFSGSDYDGICKVYTIWLCMRSPKGEGSSITSYTLHENQLFGRHVEPKENYDLINITLLYLGNHRTGNKLIELLRLVFRSNASMAEKKDKLARQYGLNLTDDMAEEMNTMCNLSEGIYEDGVKKTKEKMMQAIQMIKDKASISEIVKKTGLTEEDVRQMQLLL